MPKIIRMSKSNHVWVKVNLVTRAELRGRKFYDIFKCKNCGLQGKSFCLGELEVHGNIKNPESCRKAPVSVKIRITRCTAYGPQFENLTNNSIHEIVNPPEDKKEQHPNGKGGVWVMGVGEPVRVLFGEFIELDEKE